MLLIGYLYGITSERRLAQEVSLHLAYRWFLGYDFDVSTPDHSVRSKARTRLGSEVFEEFFRQSIELCRQAGLLEEGPVYVDSTLMRASASMDSLTKREEMVRPPLSIAEDLQRLDQEADGAEEHGSPDPGEDEGPTPPSKPVPLNQKLVSRTDPEATLVDRPRLRPPSRLQSPSVSSRSPRPGDHGCRGHYRSRGRRALAGGGCSGSIGG